MNIKNLMMGVLVVIGLTAIFERLFLHSWQDKPMNVERVRIAPKTDVYRPLLTEVDFWDRKLEIQTTQTHIETDFCALTFSNEGAALVRADFKHDSGPNQILLPGIISKEREDRTYLIAFDRETPYYFELTKHDQSDECHDLEYRGVFNGGELFKRFRIYKHKPQVDLHIIFKPSQELSEPYRLRLVYSVPSILYAASPEQLVKLQLYEDPVVGILDIQDALVNKPMDTLFARYWELPNYFGGCDKYLVHLMLNNTNQFAQRGYYNLLGENSLRAYLEGAEVRSFTEWDLSFYLGPKQTQAFGLVNNKLDQIMDYGRLYPISKFLLQVLQFLNGYVGNFGLAIILLTLLIKLFTLPFTLKGEKSIEKIAEMDRKIQHAQQKYRHNPEAFAQARTEIMQKYGADGVGGCLIQILVQIPVFWSLRNILTSSIELYMAPFLWIPNLASADPYYILPVLIGIGTFWQSSANTVDARKKMNSLGMAIFMGALFAGFSAGIGLYILVNSIFSILQTKLYRRFRSAR